MNKISDFSLYDASICKEKNIVAFSEVINPNYTHGSKSTCVVELYHGTSFYIKENVLFNTITTEVVYTCGVGGIGFNVHEIRSKCITEYVNSLTKAKS